IRLSRLVRSPMPTVASGVVSAQVMGSKAGSPPSSPHQPP
ncbi:MAG: hypothetical protein AVDCRST_MAG18-3596, partial [uncultured Thermomicrobiales bacterium]